MPINMAKMVDEMTEISRSALLKEIENDLISELAQDLIKQSSPRPRYEDGWRTVNQLLAETGLTEAVLRRILENKVRSGEYEMVKSSPRYYRMKKEKT